MSWNWLVKPQTPYRWRFVAGVVIKGLLLFSLLNLIFALLYPLPLTLLGNISVYNGLVPGRTRLPYGENPEQSYNLSLQNLDMLLASHEINGASKAADEYRVVLIGDSSVWGVLLSPETTLAGFINAATLRTSQGKRVRVFNLGYPVQSLTKDLVLLQRAMRYQPDLVIWLFTPESFAPSQQVTTQIVRENPTITRDLIARYKLNIDPKDARFVDPDFFGKTIIGQRRTLADWLRLQYYGVMWGTTSHDQTYPRFYEPHMEDFDKDATWHGFSNGDLKPNMIAFDVLRAGADLVLNGSKGQTALLLIHEPMFISRGKNSDLRYNFFYPRWLVDQFREWMTAEVNINSWRYADMWNVIQPELFTDSAVHLNPEGSRTLARGVGAMILTLANGEMLAQR